MTEAEHARLDERLRAVQEDVRTLKASVREIEIHGTQPATTAIREIERDLETFRTDFHTYRKDIEERERQRIEVENARNEAHQAETRRNRVTVAVCVLAAALSLGVTIAASVIVR